MKSITLFNILIAGSIFFTACAGDDLAGFSKSAEGVYYQKHVEGNDSTSPKLTDWVLVNMDYRLGDSLMFSSKELDKPRLF